MCFRLTYVICHMLYVICYIIRIILLLEILCKWLWIYVIILHTCRHEYLYIYICSTYTCCGDVHLLVAFQSVAHLWWYVRYTSMKPLIFCDLTVSAISGCLLLTSYGFKWRVQFQTRLIIFPVFELTIEHCSSSVYNNNDYYYYVKYNIQCSVD